MIKCLLGSELLSLNLHDDKDKKGLEDEWFARVMFVYPPRARYLVLVN